jgi:protein-S-isoprenylcysteine O-methyltransferase Ste14
MDNEGKNSVMLRALLAPTLLGGPALYILYPKWVSYFKIPLSTPLRLATTGVTLSSLPLLFWIHHHLGSFWSSDLEVQEEHHLVTSGLYQWIRHPMYTALLLFYAGTSLTSANWLVLIPNFASIMIMLSRIEKEEEMLLKKFGQEYLEYKDRTGTLLPKPVTST